MSKLSVLARSALLVAVGLLCAAPPASSEVVAQGQGCFCTGNHWSSVYYHPCVSALGLTTSMSLDNRCDVAGCNRKDCRWTATLAWVLKDSCGGTSGSLTDGGRLECGSFKNWEVNYQGALLASASFVCTNCPASGL